MITVTKHGISLAEKSHATNTEMGLWEYPKKKHGKKVCSYFFSYLFSCFEYEGIKKVTFSIIKGIYITMLFFQTDMKYKIKLESSQIFDHLL